MSKYKIVADGRAKQQGALRGWNRNSSKCLWI